MVEEKVILIFTIPFFDPSYFIGRRPANNLQNVYDSNTLKVLKFCGISEDMIASGNANMNSQAQIYTRYKTMKTEWRSYVALGRSGIAGFGLYAKKDIDMNQMVCEYVGEIIRSEVCLFYRIINYNNIHN